MTYHAKINNQVINSLGWLLFATTNIIAPSFNDRLDMVILYWLIIIMSVPFLARLFYFLFARRPIFSANEFYVFDHFRNIKYYWIDIEEIFVDADEILQIKLCRPEKYRSKFYNPIRRLLKLTYSIKRKRNLYTVDLNIVAIKKGENKLFMDKLKELSIIAKINQQNTA